MTQGDNPFYLGTSLQPFISINTLQFLDSPGMPERLKGRTASQLLGTQPLVDGARARMDPEYLRGLGESDICPRVNQLAGDGEGKGAKQAQAVIAEIAENSAWLFEALRRGDEGNREVRKSWGAEHWNFWKSIDRIVLAGGLVSGILGQAIAEAVRNLCRGLEVLLPAQPVLLPSLGAASCQAIAEGEIAVLDFGGSFVKRGIAFVKDSRIHAYKPLPSLRVPQNPSAAQLKGFFYASLRECLGSCADKEARLSISIANYLPGADVMDRGLYGLLKEDGGKPSLAERVADACNLAVDDIRILHDGSAAAQCFSGTGTAVFTIGSFIGVGFPEEGPRCALDLESLKIL